MGTPQLLGSGSSPHDTQVVYTDSGPPVGSFGILGGRGFVWCSYSGSSGLTRGEPLVAASQDLNQQNLDMTTAGLTIGQTVITGITAGGSAITANAFAEGFLMVVDGAGEATCYRIRDHSAFTASTADGSIVLYDPIQVASDADTQATLIYNKYANPEQSKALQGGPFIGVPLVTVPAGDTTTQYFWAQRVGYCPVFVEGTPKRGTSVKVSDTTAGRLKAVRDSIEVVESHTGGARSVHALDTTPAVGQMVTDAIDGEVQVVDLQMPLF